MGELIIPRHKSNLSRIEIDVENFPENLAKEGRGDHLLEDWFWQVTVENEGNPFCPEIGFWGVYIVRSKTEQRIAFNVTEENYEVIQMFPGDVPKLLLVDDVTVDNEAGIALTVLFDRPGFGTLERIHGLYQYGA